MSWNRRRDRVVVEDGWRTNIVVAFDVWRGRHRVSDVADATLLNFSLIKVFGLVGDVDRRGVMLLNRLVFVSDLSAVAMGIVCCVLHDLNSAIGQLNFVASLNGAVFLLLGVREIITGVTVFDGIRESVLFLVVIRRRRLDGVLLIVVDDRVLVDGELNRLPLEFVVLYFSGVICEGREDSRLVILEMGFRNY